MQHFDNRKPGDLDVDCDSLLLRSGFGDLSGSALTLYRERCTELLREAEIARMLQDGQEQEQPRRRVALHRQMLMVVGRWMVAGGGRLQSLAEIR